MTNMPDTMEADIAESRRVSAEAAVVLSSASGLVPMTPLPTGGASEHVMKHIIKTKPKKPVVKKPAAAKKATAADPDSELLENAWLSNGADACVLLDPYITLDPIRVACVTLGLSR